MNKKSYLMIFLALGLPALVFAQDPNITPVPGGGVLNILNTTKNVILGILWMIAFTFTVFQFVLAGFKYLTSKGDPSKVAEAHKSVLWGGVGAAVIVLAWSILSIVGLQLGL